MILLIPIIILYVVSKYIKITFNLVAVAIDCCVVMLIAALLLHPYAKEIATDQSVLVTTLLLSAICVALYVVLLLGLCRLLPKASKVINFIIVYLGVAAITPYFLVRIFSENATQVLKNNVLNTILFCILYFIIAIPFYKKRMDIVNSLLGKREIISQELEDYQEYMINNE